MVQFLSTKPGPGITQSSFKGLKVTNNNTIITIFLKMNKEDGGRGGGGGHQMWIKKILQVIFLNFFLRSIGGGAGVRGSSKKILN